jgi:MerR family transcriptional regulator, thiopeptide resistance regulator
MHEDIESSARFTWCECSDSRPVESNEHPDGTVVHGEVRLDGARIWLHRVGDDLASPRTLTQLNSGLVVHVEDVDAHFARARDAGAVIDRVLDDQPDGHREYGARDLEGHHWRFATPTAAPALPDR